MSTRRQVWIILSATLSTLVLMLVLLAICNELIASEQITGALETLSRAGAIIVPLLLYLGSLWIGLGVSARRYARQHGVAAMATVHTARPTRWFHTTAHGKQFEYYLELEISAPNAPPYAVPHYAYLANPPAPGSQLAVTVHPRRPATLVLGAPAAQD